MCRKVGVTFIGSCTRGIALDKLSNAPGIDGVPAGISEFTGGANTCMFPQCCLGMSILWKEATLLCHFSMQVCPIPAAFLGWTPPILMVTLNMWFSICKWAFR